MVTRAHATRVLLQDLRAVGVEYAHRGQTVRANADREVILCGGAINSPQLLMLSGIGPGDHLVQMESCRLSICRLGKTFRTIRS